MSEAKATPRALAAIVTAAFLAWASVWISGSRYLAAYPVSETVFSVLLAVLGGIGLFVLVRWRSGQLVDSVQNALDGSLRYEDLFEHHPTPMWIYDSQTQRFLAVNDAALHRYGYTEQEFLGMTLRDIRPKEDVPVFMAHHTSTSRKGYGEAGIWRHTTKAGELIHMHISLNRTTYRGRGATLVMAREVTQEVQARQALESLKDSLEERVKQRTAELETANRELDAFARSAAHDLRTPLNGILGFAQILGYQLPQAAPAQRESLAHIERSARSMLDLIEGLLAMSQVAQKALVVEAVDLSALAARTLEDLRNAEPGRSVAAAVQPGLVTEGDPTLLASLLGNLLSNAWKYTSKRPDPSIEFGGRALDDGSHAYYVRDNGVGFAMERAQRLFKPFQRLHSATDFRGHGVGLATCLRVVERHGGRIWPESEVGQGTTIWFTLCSHIDETVSN